MRMPATTSPLRRKVMTGLEHAPGAEPPAAAGTGVAPRNAPAFTKSGLNDASAEPFPAGARGTKDSDIKWDCDNYKGAVLTLSKTVTRRLISLARSVLGIGTVAP